MNWVPLLFINDVCHQLHSSSLKELNQLTKSWSKFGSDHCGKRREFAFNCKVDDKEGAYFLDKSHGSSFFGQICDLDSEYDRITSVTCEEKENRRRIRVSLEELENDVLPIIVPLAANCSWQYHSQESSAELIFKAFKSCHGINIIQLEKQSQESRDFVSRQVEIGNVEELHFQTNASVTWPDRKEFAKTLRIFVNSSRFKGLRALHRLENDFELVALFLKRALAGELKAKASIRIDGITFSKSGPSTLHREHRDDDSEKIAWRIPKSNCRIVDEWGKKGCFPKTVLLKVVE